MDYKKIKIDKSHIKGHKEYIRQLEIIKNAVNANIMNIQDDCEHNLILSYGIDDSGENILKKSRCLVCGNYFELDGTFDMFSERHVSSNSILDITEMISKNIQQIMIKGENRLYLRADEKFNELINSKDELSLEMIKIQIINDLLLYERDLKVKRLSKVKID